MADVVTVCKECKRCVMASHLDRDGYCSVCAPVIPAASKVSGLPAFPENIVTKSDRPVK